MRIGINDSVKQSSVVTLRRRCSCGASCPSCRKRRQLVQRRSTAPTVDFAPAIVHDVLHTPGQPLDPSVLPPMESAFQSDFSRVRVHADSRSAQSARAVHALAYTVGNHVVFAAGQYQPSTTQGRRLLAHELAHVVQQSGADHAAGPLRIGPADDAAERSAERIADRVARGLRAETSLRAQYALRRAGANPADAFAGYWYPKPDKYGNKVFIRVFEGGSAEVMHAYKTGGGPTDAGGTGKISGSQIIVTKSPVYDTYARPQIYTLTGPGTLTRTVTRADGTTAVTTYIRTPGSVADPVVPAEPPKLATVCGPDAAPSLAATLVKVKADFKAFKPAVKAAKCNAVTVFGKNPITAAWDIGGLINRPWLSPSMMAGCSRPAAGPTETKACIWSVQVGKSCQNVYTPNYALYGTIFRQCADWFQTLPGSARAGVNPWSSSVMWAHMMAYKPLKFAVGTFHPIIDKHQVEWADLAYKNNGWQSVNGQPTSDYECDTTCKYALPGHAMTYRWEPVPTYGRIMGTSTNAGPRLAIQIKPVGSSADDEYHGLLIEGKGARASFTAILVQNTLVGRIEIQSRGARPARGEVQIKIVDDKTLELKTEPFSLIRYFPGSSDMLRFNITSITRGR